MKATTQFDAPWSLQFLDTIYYNRTHFSIIGLWPHPARPAQIILAPSIIMSYKKSKWKPPSKKEKGGKSPRQAKARGRGRHATASALPAYHFIFANTTISS
jgi:hypothetical protein